MKKTYALVGASAAVGAAIGPLIGGFVTTYLSWRVGFLRSRPSSSPSCCQASSWSWTCHTRACARSTTAGAVLSVLGHGRRGPRASCVWQEGGEFVGAAHGASAPLRSGGVGPMARPASTRRQGDPPRPEPVQGAELPHGHSPDGAPADHPRRRNDRPSALSAGDPGVQRDAGGPLVSSVVAHHVRRRPPDGEEGRGPTPGQHHPDGIRPGASRDGPGHPGHPSRRVGVGAAGPAPDRRSGPRPPGLPAQQLHPGPHRGGTGQRSGQGPLRASFGLSLGWPWQAASSLPRCRRASST